MGDTSIQWTNKTWNPVRGCSRVSEGCRNCYAERQAARYSSGAEGEKGALPFHGFAENTKAGPRWTGRVELVPHMLDLPLRWKKPIRIFVNSMSDLFHEALPFEHIAAVFGVMAACPQHTFQVLTKRPERAREFFAWIESQRGPLTVALVSQGGAWPNGKERSAESILCAYFASERHGARLPQGPWAAWPLPNVWLGTSVEDQATADRRIPELLDCPAAVRFVSYEPALCPVDFDRAVRGGGDPARGISCLGWVDGYGYGIDWLIFGGESGPGARPCDMAWGENARDQCAAAGVAFFWKQCGSDPLIYKEVGTAKGGCHVPFRLRDRKGGDMSEWPAEWRVRQFPEARQ